MFVKLMPHAFGWKRQFGCKVEKATKKLLGTTTSRSMAKHALKYIAFGEEARKIHRWFYLWSGQKTVKMFSPTCTTAYKMNLVEGR